MINKSVKSSVKILLLHLIFITALVGLVLITDGFCLFRRVIDFPCPCCGLTRAWLTFFSGDILLAFQYNPCFINFPFMMMIVVHRKTRVMKFVDVKVTDAIVVLNAMVIAGCYIARIITGSINFLS